MNVFPHLFSSSFLLVCLGLLVILTDLEVPQLVRLLIASHHTQPVPQVVLLQVLLCQILQIPGAERQVKTKFQRLSSVLLRFQCAAVHLLENCFSDETLILFFMRPTWTMFPRFPVFPFTLILSLRKVSCQTEHSDALGKGTLVRQELGK